MWLSGSDEMLFIQWGANLACKVLLGVRSCSLQRTVHTLISLREALAAGGRVLWLQVGGCYWHLVGRSHRCGPNFLQYWRQPSQ